MVRVHNSCNSHRRVFLVRHKHTDSLWKILFIWFDSYHEECIVSDFPFQNQSSYRSQFAKAGARWCQTSMAPSSICLHLLWFKLYHIHLDVSSCIHWITNKIKESQNCRCWKGPHETTEIHCIYKFLEIWLPLVMILFSSLEKSVFFRLF